MGMTTGEWVIVGLLVGPGIVALVVVTLAIWFSFFGGIISNRRRARIDRIYDKRENR
jgi:hypothetical protein